MRKSQDVIGLPVLSISSGKQLGVVRDLLFDNRQSLFGLLVENQGWVKRGRYIPADCVTSFGRDAVTVDNDRVLQSLEQHDGLIGVNSGKQKLKGLPIMTTTGQELGRLENVYFMEELGTLIGYELTDGFLTDIREGRKALRTDQPLTWGDDALVMSAETSAELKPTSDRK